MMGGNALSENIGNECPDTRHRTIMRKYVGGKHPSVSEWTAWKKLSGGQMRRLRIRWLSVTLDLEFGEITAVGNACWRTEKALKTK